MLTRQANRLLHTTTTQYKTSLGEKEETVQEATGVQLVSLHDLPQIIKHTIYLCSKKTESTMMAMSGYLLQAENTNTHIHTTFTSWAREVVRGR